MRILGIDYGKAKIGLAIADGPLAEPLGVLNTNQWEKGLGRIIQEQGIEKIVLGLSEGLMAEETKVFAKRLGEITNLPIDFQDETLTSQEAVVKMRQIGKKDFEEDAVAAAIILQNYLDFKENV